MRGPLSIGVAVALIGVAVALVLRVPAARATREQHLRASVANSRSYVDPYGDGAYAPDISTVTVSNDQVGTIEIRVDTPNFPNPTWGMFFSFLLDTDQNPGTGDDLGADYLISISETMNSILLHGWNGSWDYTVPQSTLQGVAWSYGPTVSINRSDLANTVGMNFWLRSSWNDSHSVDYDFAPDIGLPPWSYKLVFAPPVRCLVPRVIGLRLSSARSRIGRAHCAVGRIRRAQSRRVGRVIGQRPRPGRTLARGSRINLVIGRS
jgi:hypothetical protein